MKRFTTALEVLQTDYEFRVIARSLAAAAEEAAEEGVGAERDAAVRAIAYCLARLCRVDEITYGYDPTTLADTYCTLMKECKERACEAAGEQLDFPLPGPVTDRKRLPL